MSGSPFSRANRLWFRYGRTVAALSAYVEARQAAPGDPRTAFQLARVLWSFDRVDEARHLMEQAAAAAGDRLSEAGQIAVTHWRLRLSDRPPTRRFPDVAPEHLDRDRLEAGPLPLDDWRIVAEAAADREMFGLAVYALDRWGHPPDDAEEAQEVARIRRARDLDEAVLGELLAPRRPHQPRRPPFPGGGRRPVPPVPAVPGHGPPALPGGPAPAAGPGPGPARESRGLPDLPLVLDVRADPADGPVGTPTTLVATLRNPTPEPQVVNRRMLLNSPGGEGEVWLSVRGPAGYRNMRGFRVNAGMAPTEFVVPLAPGSSVEQSWALDDYESLHVPGEYEVELTYHDPRGKVAGSTRFRRG